MSFPAAERKRLTHVFRDPRAWFHLFCCGRDRVLPRGGGRAGLKAATCGVGADQGIGDQDADGKVGGGVGNAEMGATAWRT